MEKLEKYSSRYSYYLELLSFSFLHVNRLYLKYSTCPKISYIKMSDKMAYANRADHDQIAVWAQLVKASLA